MQLERRLWGRDLGKPITGRLPLGPENPGGKAVNPGGLGAEPPLSKPFSDFLFSFHQIYVDPIDGMPDTLTGAVVFGFDFVVEEIQMQTFLPHLPRRSSAQRSVRTELVVMVLPVAQAILQIRGFEISRRVELFQVRALRTFHLAIQMGRSRLDGAEFNAALHQPFLKAISEKFAAAVSLDALDGEWKFLKYQLEKQK